MTSKSFEDNMKGTGRNAKKGEHGHEIGDKDKTIGQDPRTTANIYRRGELKSTKGCDKAVEQEPDNTNDWCNWIVWDFDQVLELGPNNSYTWCLRGIERAEKGEFEEAIKDYDTAVELEPENVDALIPRGMAKSALGQYEEAIEDYMTALELEPDNVDAWFGCGQANAGAGDYEEAILHYTMAIESNFEMADAWFWRGIANKMLGKQKAAGRKSVISTSAGSKPSLRYYKRARADLQRAADSYMGIGDQEMLEKCAEELQCLIDLTKGGQ